ncbi:MAG: hypothetical protein ACOX9C_10610 [Kiritimatiellia bacterium]|jgi:type II restriction enzyme
MNSTSSLEKNSGLRRHKRQSPTHLSKHDRLSTMRTALCRIGSGLGFRTWIPENNLEQTACNDWIDATINLQNEPLLNDCIDAQRAILELDCVWFSGNRHLPAAMIVETGEGIGDGLIRLLTLYEYIKPFQTRWVIVAPDDDRNLVFTHCQKPQFRKMKPRFFPYSAVEELNSLCSNRKIRGITEDFLDCFMEQTVPEN